MTVDEFIEFYNMDNEVPKEYIQEFIDTYQLTVGSLGLMRWDKKVKEKYGESVRFDCNVYEIYKLPVSDVDLSEFIEDIEKIVIILSISNGTEFYDFTACVIDLKQSKRYITSKNILDDYSKAETILNMDDKEILMLKEKLNKMVNKDGYSHKSQDYYQFDLTLVNSDKTIKRIHGDSNQRGLIDIRYLVDGYVMDYVNKQYATEL